MDPREISNEEFDLENPERRAFTIASVLALLGTVSITISGCGDSYSPPGSPSPPPSSGGATGAISANHGHSVTVTSAQLNSNNTIVVGFGGAATHPHTVELTVQDLGQIRAGQRVTKISSTDPSPDAGTHSHTVTFN